MIRRRHLLAHVILVVLLYGRNSCVTWTGPLSCTIETARFAELMGTDSSRIRRYCDYLYRQGYLSSCDWGHGYIDLTLRPPVDRSAAA